MAIDDLFEPVRPEWRGLTENELLSKEFTASDPEGLDNVSDGAPPDEEPEVEAAYDMTARGRKVRCVYCRYPNHFKGIVVRYHPSGARRLVGRDCALTHYGVDFGAKLTEFDAAQERQSYLRRQRVLLAASAEIFHEFEELKVHPIVRVHDRLARRWREGIVDLAPAIAGIVRRGEMLSIDREVRDEAAERQRKERLGNRFEEERQKAKDSGKRWQLTKHVNEVVGPLDGGLFFAAGVAVATRLEEIQAAVKERFRFLSRENLRTAQISAALRDLSGLRDAVAHEFARLAAVLEAFDQENLARIAKWANERASGEAKRVAAFENRKVERWYDRYVVKERSITDTRGSDRVADLPPRYHVPKPTLLEALTRASSSEYEP